MSDQALDETLVTIGSASPFLPGTKIMFAWDSTSLGLLKTCPRLYQYTIIEGWSPKGESLHLRFGQEYHQALQEYDVSRANGVGHEDSVFDTVRALASRVWDWDVDRDSKAGKYKNRDTLFSLVVDYLDHFCDDPAQTYIRADGTPAVELSFRFELDWGPSAYLKLPAGEFSLGPGAINYIDGAEVLNNQPYLLCGHLDRVVSFNDQLLVMDHKTSTSTLGSYWFDQWSPNNQMSLYTYAGQVVLSTPIKGVIISGAQIMLDQPNRFVRGFSYRTPDQLEEWLDDLRFWLISAENYAQLDHWPMNDTACDKFGGCRFRGICSKQASVRESFLRSDFEQLPPSERWNPLKSRG